MRILVLILALATAAFSVQAAETPWVDHNGMLQTRIVAASPEMAGEGVPLLAWEAKLAPGWKTYWRSPGEAGLPVRVHVGQEELEPLYPLPERFELFGIQTFGYGKQLLLPFHLTEASTGHDKVRVDFMVCKDICVPFEQTYDITEAISGADGSLHDFRIETWMQKVPAKEAAPAGLDVIAAKVAGRPGHQKLIVDVQADNSLESVDLLAEVNDMFHFGIPKVRLLEDGKKARLVLPAMTAGKPYELRGETVRFTLTDGKGQAIDRTLELSK